MEADNLRFLGLSRRAGKLSTGEEGTKQAVRAGKAKLILLASDASGNARKRAEELAARAQVPMITLDAEKASLSEALGIAGGAMMAVCDDGFAIALEKRIRKSREE